MDILRAEIRMKGSTSDRGSILRQIKGPNPNERPKPIITAPIKVSLTRKDSKEAISRLLRSVSAMPAPAIALVRPARTSIVKGLLM